MSQRGVLNLCHSDGQFDAFARRGNAMLLQGDDAELLDPRRGPRGLAVPRLRRRALSDPRRAAAPARRDGAARRRRLGVRAGGGRARGRPDPELRGHRLPHRGRARARGRDHARAISARGASGMAVAGRTSQVGAMAGLRLPIESQVLQAFVTEGLKPVLPGGRDLRDGAFLHQPVGQGRAGLRRRPRLLQLLRPAREPADRRARDGGRHGADADDRHARGCCARGAGSPT